MLSYASIFLGQVLGLTAADAVRVTAPDATASRGVESMNKVEPGTRWAGRQTVVGQRSLPVLGTFETRTDLWVLATIRRTPDRWAVEQTTCGVRVADVAGVSVRFPEATLQRLPPIEFTLRREADGTFEAAPWRSGWDATDLDADGWGGLTLMVTGPMCSGRLAVSSDSETSARVRIATREALELDLKVRVGQRVLESDGWCLRLADRQTDERLVGRARYDPLPATATCADVLDLPPALPTAPP